MARLPSFSGPLSAVALALTALTGASQLPAQSQARPTVHVAVEGDDRAPGSAQQPVKTIERALALLREKRSAQGGELVLHAGTHFLAAPLKLGAEDSGRAQFAKNGSLAVAPAPLVIRGAPEARAVVSAGERLTGFQEVTLGGRTAWQIALPEVAAGKRWFRHLWVNGQPAQRARWPKRGYLTADAAEGPAGNEGAQDRFRFAAGDLQSAWVKPEVDCVVLHFWCAPRLPLAEVDESTRVARLAHRLAKPLFEKPGEPPAYFLENVAEQLTEPGEWHLERATGLLTYLPRAEESLAEAEIIIPRHRAVIEISGAEPARPAQFITLENLTLSHSEAALSPEDYRRGEQAAFIVPGALILSWAERIAVNQCVIENVGNYGIEVRDSKDIQITRNTLRQLGAGGIKVGPRGQARGVVITDNTIQGGGRHWLAAAGILLGSHPGNTIAHNLVYDFHYTGISVGWSWGYKEAAGYGNVIEWNHIHHVGQGSLSDLGGIYTLGMSSGSRIRYNLLHDIRARTYGGWGIYLDEGSTGFLVENNIVARTSQGGFFLHYGADNLVMNNIFFDGGTTGVGVGVREYHQSLVFTRNLVVSKDRLALSGARVGVANNTRVALRAVFDQNLYAAASADDPQFTSNHLDWAAWQRHGFDRRSVLAAPGFREPDKLDFRLPPDSPALKLGFREFSLEGVGPRPAEPTAEEGRYAPAAAPAAEKATGPAK